MAIWRSLSTKSGASLTQEIAILSQLASQARAAGIEIAEISVGSTPTARFIARQAGVTEMRPGNYVFFDRTQVGLEAAAIDNCAMTVLSTVVSRPSPTRLNFDAGSKTLTADGVRGFGSPIGHGLVFPSIEATAPDSTIVIQRLSEEHATAQVPESCRLKPGDRVRIVPNHSCVVTNLADELVLVEGNAIVGTLKVSARGKNYRALARITAPSPGRRGARLARREEGECPEHLTDEQRRRTG